MDRTVRCCLMESSTRKTIISVLMCSHNRQAKTLRCLHDLFNQSLDSQTICNVVLVDDGSTDGTSEKLAKEFPNVKVVKGDGTLYWSGAMRVAYQAAEESDYYLWLNDDLHLYPNSLQSVLDLSRRFESNSIITGAIRNTETGLVSYGGMKRISKTRMRFAVLEPLHLSCECDATNGNFVLIPKSVYKALGNIDSAFIHAHGDIDFGLRARKLGFKIHLSTQYVGETETRFLEERVYKTGLGIGQRIKAALNLKALRPSEWFLICYRHSNGNVLMSFASPYMRILKGRPIGFVQRPKFKM